MYKDKFVLSIIHDGSPVKETGRRSNKEVAIPFGSEYKVRLKNKNDRSCTARVFIDGKKVSQLGDFIITAGGTVDLERFVDRSLTEGKRFKFVTLDHEDVDDPTSSDNGIIEVQFRLAKEHNGIKILPHSPAPYTPPNYKWPEPIPYHWEDNNGTSFKWIGGFDATFNSGDFTVNYCNSSGENSRSFKKCSSASYSIPVCSVMDTHVESGATVEGGKSAQSFTYSDLEVDNNNVVTLRLKMVGIKKEKSMTKHKYCTNCGNAVRSKDRYCSSCGHRRQ